MRESFFGLNVSVRGLYSAQRNLDVVSHNLSNASTPGYSRQQAVQVASKPIALRDGTGMIGTGSDVISIQRIRDEYLDYKYWSENVSYKEWTTKSTLLNELEAAFNEPSDSGFSTVLDSFFASMQELSKDPDSPAVRAIVKERGVTIAKYFNNMARHFEKLQSDVNDMVKSKVEEINSVATQIQELNRQIYRAELDGSTANDLRDQRTVLVDTLSGIVNISVNEVVVGKLPSGADDKHFSVSISGKALVDHYDVSRLAVEQRPEKLNEEEDISNLYEVVWADGNSLEVKSGELKGYLDMRDGNDSAPASAGYQGSLKESPAFKGIPYYIKKMNEFVRTWAMCFNEGYIQDSSGTIQDGLGHADGFGIDPDGSGPLTAPTGIRFFTMLGADGKPLDSTTFIDGETTAAGIADRYKNITAKNFSVSSDVIEDCSSTIAASGDPSQVGNIDNLQALLDMRHDTHMFSEGAPEDFMKSLVATLGIDSQMALMFAENQENVVGQVVNRRLSTSGVSTNEELTDMIRFQHAYNASAMMITTMSQVYDTLINKMGV